MNAPQNAPLSGMSMNSEPLAPTLGMLAAAAVFVRARHGTPPYRAKLHHDDDKRCIFSREDAASVRQTS
jgi:hypothetical protein